MFSGVFTAFTIIVFVLGIFIYRTFIIVHMREACVKERFGKFSGVLKPGFHFLIPFLDKIAYRHEMREQVLDIPSQSCITRDNIQVEVDGVVYLRIIDPEKASYGIEDYRRASINLAQTTMRSEIGKISLEMTFAERETINVAIVKEIDKASDPWGVKVLRYEIKNITPSAKVIETLEKQMEAERTKRAEITLANAEKESVINISEGQQLEAINISEGEKQKRILEATGKARQISLLAESTAKGIKMIAEAISTPGGQEAVKMRIVEQYIEEFAKILKTTNTTVVPSQLANIKGFFEGVHKVSSEVSRKKYPPPRLSKTPKNLPQI
ncbi:SPFH domain-containing protein [candidate division CSSED10-310 bacterium]|uniref:SPFH domain-containing protein n=1 Tax=candidate division CSSED10-310 bacterium TaxID=2855610 RepID=A0ABV6Z6B8_UNCC1